MSELIIALALVGTVAAAVWDLFTTEVPDEIPVLMIISGVLFWYLTSLGSDLYPLFVSLIVGTLVFAIGVLMYKKGQWGGADAFILAAIAYMIPLRNGSVFMIDYIINFFIVSAVYMVIYSVVLGLRHPRAMSLFGERLQKTWKLAVGVPLVLYVATMILFAGLLSPMKISLLYAAIILLILFWLYGKIIEEHLFKRRISVSKLKEGDVLEGMIWRGITKKEIAAIRKTKKYVTIKEGVRFVPVFAINLVVTLVFGNLLFFII